MTKGLQIREIALDGLLEILEKKQYSHKIIQGILQKYAYLEKQDRAFLLCLLKGTLERLLQLDYVIDQFSIISVKKMRPVIRMILRCGVYQLFFMDHVPSHAVCNECTKLAKKKGFSSLQGFVNAVLRTIDRKRNDLVYPSKEKNWRQYCSICYSIPEWILAEWESQYTRETVEKIAASFFEKNGLSIRRNRIKKNAEVFERQMQEQGVQLEKSNYLPYAYRIFGYDQIEALQAFQDGLFYIQDESTMLACEAANVPPGSVVIDVCAAPGGKTFWFAEQVGKSGKVYARDLTEQKIQQLEENRARLGYETVETMVWDARKFHAESVETADLVIADLPCSGLGVLGKKIELKYHMTPKSQQQLVALQQEILSVVQQYVKPGGLLLFSTCTIHHAENEDNVDWFLKNFPFTLEPVADYLPEQLRKKIPTETFQLLPGVSLDPEETKKMDGFFFARFRKKGK